MATSNKKQNQYWHQYIQQVEHFQLELLHYLYYNYMLDRSDITAWESHTKCYYLPHQKRKLKGSPKILKGAP